MKKLLMTAAFGCLLSTGALAQENMTDQVTQDQLPVDGCYQAFWLQDLGNLIGVDLPVGTYCPQERHESPEQHTTREVHQPPAKEPPHQPCKW